MTAPNTMQRQWWVEGGELSRKGKENPDVIPRHRGVPCPSPCMALLERPGPLGSIKLVDVQGSSAVLGGHLRKTWAVWCS